MFRTECWKCSHCGQLFKKKEDCEKHEESCESVEGKYVQLTLTCTGIYTPNFEQNFEEDTTATPNTFPFSTEKNFTQTHVFTDIKYSKCGDVITSRKIESKYLAKRDNLKQGYLKLIVCFLEQLKDLLDGLDEEEFDINEIEKEVYSNLFFQKPDIEELFNPKK